MSDQNQQVQKWRDKYLEALKENEEHEKAWKNNAEVMRKAIVRVSLAADGMDARLDEALASLRDLVKRDIHPQQLETQIEHIGELIIQLENQKKSTASKFNENIGRLINPVEQIALPKEARKLLKNVKSSIKNTSPDDELFFTDLVKLFEFVMSEPELDGSKGKESLMSRWFSVDKPEPEPEVSEDAEDIPTQVRDILLRLLEKLRLPPEFDVRAESIRKKLTRGLKIEQLPATIDAIVDLVLESSKEENNLIEHFLQSLGGRLEQIESFLEFTGESQSEQHGQTEDLNSVMRTHVAEMQQSMQQATTLAQLTAAMESNLDGILDKMDEFIHNENQRYESALREIAHLKEKLEDTEQETSRLRDTLSEQATQAEKDALTRLPNRAAYEKRLRHEFSRWQRYQQPLTLMICDIDHFKQVNDTYGHAAGDKILKAIARILRSNIRTTDFICRYGGEEFVILMPQTSAEEAMNVANKLRQRVNDAPFHSSSGYFQVTISGGLDEFGEGDSTDKVFERADKALYKAKENGRNQICTP